MPRAQPNPQQLITQAASTYSGSSSSSSLLYSAALLEYTMCTSLTMTARLTKTMHQRRKVIASITVRSRLSLYSV
jgi:hypothetical protein